jgi:hypothetical protein
MHLSYEAHCINNLIGFAPLIIVIGGGVCIICYVSILLEEFTTIFNICVAQTSTK